MKENKKISLFSATALSIATMVGSGWLFSSQLAARYAGNWSFASWILSGFIVMMIGLCLAVVVAAYPVTGVTTRSSSLSHNNTFGMPFAFANWFGILVVVANEAQATGEYLFAAMKSTILMSNGEVTYLGKFVEVCIIVIYLVVNFYGVKLLSRVNNIVTAFKIIMPISTVVLLLISHFDMTNFHLATNNVYSAKSVIAAMVGAGLIYSLNGFQTVVSFAGEVKNPKLNVPLAMIISIILVTCLYMGLQCAFMGAVPHANLIHGWAQLNFSSPLFNLAMLLNLNILASFLIADSIISPSGTGCTYLGAASRMLYAMAKEGQVPGWLAKIAPEHIFSRRSLIFNFILAAGILLNGGNWAVLMVIITGCNIIGYMAAPVSMGAIKPKTRVFGCLVFILITMLMTTIPVHDMLIIDTVMTIVMVTYLLIQFESNSVKKVINLIAPFLIYLWSFCVVKNEIIMVLIGAIFYILVTHKKYVAYCIAQRKFEAMNFASEIQVNTDFDGGSIEVVNIADPKNLQFKIRKDTNSHFAQWFYFQLNNVQGVELGLSLLDLKTTAYPEGWQNYNVVMSYDNVNWTRCISNFDGDKLNFALTPKENRVYFAYFEPYSYTRHLELVDFASHKENVSHEILGKTRQNRNMDLLVFGNKFAKNKIWITARQHPGETMASFFMEGLIHRLVDSNDAVVRSLLKDAVFYLMPNMNPDGGYNGNLRVNSVGSNLNREWLTPSLEKSPEVLCVREKMLETGVDMFFDIHGDEAIPYIFTAGCEDNPSFSEKQLKLSAKFAHYFMLVNPDYQTKFGYEKGQFNQDTPTLATNWVGNQFDCLALTLEMPFKDNDNLPDMVNGWNGKRSALLGQSLLTAIHCVFSEMKHNLDKVAELPGLEASM